MTLVLPMKMSMSELWETCLFPCGIIHQVWKGLIHETKIFTIKRCAWHEPMTCLLRIVLFFQLTSQTPVIVKKILQSVQNIYLPRSPTSEGKGNVADAQWPNVSLVSKDSFASRGFAEIPGTGKTFTSTQVLCATNTWAFLLMFDPPF